VASAGNERSAVNWRMGRLKNALIERQIEPAAKLEARLPDRSGVAESKLLMEGDAGAICFIDAANHDVVLLRDGLFDELPHERLRQALAAMVSMDVDRMFNGIFVCGPCAKSAIACKSEKFAGA